MAKKKKKSKGGLMDGLISAGFVSEKDARKIKREQRQERKAAKDEGGHDAVVALERQKAAELLRLQEEKKARTRKAEDERKAQEKAERLTELTRDRYSLGGNARFYFILPDQYIDFVEVDDQASRQLSHEEAAVIQMPGARLGEYVVLPANSKFDELRRIAPELVLFPR